MIVGISKNRRIYSSLVRVRLWSLKHNTIFIIITIVSHIGSYTDLDQYGVLVCVCVIEENETFILSGELFTNFAMKCHLDESMCFLDEFAMGLLGEK